MIGIRLKGQTIWCDSTEKKSRVKEDEGHEFRKKK